MSKQLTKSKSQFKPKAASGIQPGSDIIQLILNDHKELKMFIETMKGEKPSYSQKKAAFEKFAPLLVAHANPEEQTWYKRMKAEKDSRIEGIEGDVEHGLADQLCEELKRTTDQDLFRAKVKVLAELVEHHIEEEEKHMLPDFKKESTAQERIALGESYIKIQEALGGHGDDGAALEKSAINQQEARPY